MEKCSNCLNLQTSNFHWCECINDSPDINIERNCRYYKAMTIADFIRTMKNEELAKILNCPNGYVKFLVGNHNIATGIQKC